MYAGLLNTCLFSSNISFSRIACYITFSSQMTIFQVFCLFNRQIQSLAGYGICISIHLSRQLFPLPLRCTCFFPVLHVYFQDLLSYIMFVTNCFQTPTYSTSILKTHQDLLKGKPLLCFTVMIGISSL